MRAVTRPGGLRGLLRPHSHDLPKGVGDTISAIWGCRNGRATPARVRLQLRISQEEDPLGGVTPRGGTQFGGELLGSSAIMNLPAGEQREMRAFYSITSGDSRPTGTIFRYNLMIREVDAFDQDIFGVVANHIWSSHFP